MNKFQEYHLAQKSDELKKLILENPDLPLVVLCGDEANTGYYGWMFCSSIRFGIEEILDCDYLDYNECVFTEREYLAEVVADRLIGEYEDRPEEEFDAAVDEKLAELEPYWTKVIAIYADN